MSIIYSSVCRGSTILCSHGFQQSGENYEQTALAVLSNIPTRNDGKTSVTAGNTKFHCIVENGFIYMCAAKPEFETRPCFAFLTEIKDQFRNHSFMVSTTTAGSHALDSEFNNVLSKQMERFSKPGAADKMSVLQGQVKEITGVMSQNIESVIQRGERLDDLMDKTDDLEAASATFAKTASKIKKKYWWKNLKMKLIVACVVILVLAGIGLAIGLGVKGSGSSDNSDGNVTPQPSPTPNN